MINENNLHTADDIVKAEENMPPLCKPCAYKEECTEGRKVPNSGHCLILQKHAMITDKN